MNDMEICVFIVAFYGNVCIYIYIYHKQAFLSLILKFLLLVALVLCCTFYYILYNTLSICLQQSKTGF